QQQRRSSREQGDKDRPHDSLRDARTANVVAVPRNRGGTPAVRLGVRRPRLFKQLARGGEPAQAQKEYGEVVAVSCNRGVVLAIGLEVRRQGLLAQLARGRQLAEVLEHQGEVVAVSRNCGVVLAVGLEV